MISIIATEPQKLLFLRIFFGRKECRAGALTKLVVLAASNGFANPHKSLKDENRIKQILK